MPIDARYHEQVRLLSRCCHFSMTSRVLPSRGGHGHQPLRAAITPPIGRHRPGLPAAGAPRRGTATLSRGLQRLAEAFNARLPGVRAELLDNRRVNFSRRSS